MMNTRATDNMKLNITDEVGGVKCAEPMLEYGVDEAGVKLYCAAEDSSESGNVVDSGNVRQGQYLVFDGDELIGNFQSDESVKAVNFGIGWIESKKRHTEDN